MTKTNSKGHAQSEDYQRAVIAQSSAVPNTGTAMGRVRSTVTSRLRGTLKMIITNSPYREHENDKSTS